MNNFLEKHNHEVSEAGRRLDAALVKLGLSEKKAVGIHRRGRLLFCLDLTGFKARFPATPALLLPGMFDAIKTIGGVAVKLVYYRGTHECRAGAWQMMIPPLSSAGLMAGLACEGGSTQIARILRHALAEPNRPDGVVFIGDHCEEAPADLVKLAVASASVPFPCSSSTVARTLDAASLTGKGCGSSNSQPSAAASIAKFKPLQRRRCCEIVVERGGFQ